MTPKKRALWAFACSGCFVLLAYAAMQSSSTAIGNRAVYILLPGIVVDIGMSGNPHRGSGDFLGPIVTFGVSITVWFLVMWAALTVVGRLLRSYRKNDESA